jgi:hypothetical protein
MRALLVLIALAATACSRVAALDTRPMDLSEPERAAVREQADRSRGEKEWKDAWNQEVEAGADRARLETIALEAAADSDGDAKDMFAELRRRWGGLSETAQDGLARVLQKAEAEKDYGLAVEVLILAADDAPTYAGAWDLYRRAPPDEAVDILGEIRLAREAHAREAAEGSKGPR